MFFQRTFSFNLAKYTADNNAIRQFWHFIQLIFTDKFQQFDTITDNQKVYGSEDVPLYNLSNLNIPLTVFYGTNDILVNSTVSLRNFKACLFRF